MARRIIWSKLATENKSEIFRYWNRHNKSKTYSIKLNKAFSKRILALADRPLATSETNSESIRTAIVEKFRILFYHDTDVIEVLSIFDMRRNTADIPFK